jgi:hypothetical protein
MFGFFSSQVCATGWSGVERLSNATWISFSTRGPSFVKESQEVPAITSRLAFVKDFIECPIQRGEQIRCAVTRVVISAFIGRGELDRSIG